MRERRRSNRFFLKGKVFLTFGEKEYELPLTDLSVTGIGVMLDVAVLGRKPSGAVGTCRIEAPGLHHPVEAFVSVMRMRQLGSRCLVGFRFESISDEHLAVISDYAPRPTHLL